MMVTGHGLLPAPNAFGGSRENAKRITGDVVRYKVFEM